MLQNIIWNLEQKMLQAQQVREPIEIDFVLYFDFFAR